MDKKNPLYYILGISAFFFVVFIAVVMGVVLSLGNSNHSSQSKIFSKSEALGLIEISGTIMESKKIVNQLDDFAEDKMIKGILLRINSPGGAVAPSQEIYEAVKQAAQKKPVYVSMSSLAASGGYYIACGATKVFANPGTMTGSIGVILQFADLSRLFDWAKVNPYNIKTGKFKDIGSPNRQMTADEKDLLQNMAENVLSQFRKAVAEGRKLTMEKVVEVSDGRIFSGEQAKNLKLVDELGGMQDVIKALAKEVGIKDKPVLVQAAKKKKFLERILGGFDDDESSESSESSSFAQSSVFEKLIFRFLENQLGVSHTGSASMNVPLMLMPSIYQR